MQRLRQDCKLQEPEELKTAETLQPAGRKHAVHMCLGLLNELSARSAQTSQPTSAHVYSFEFFSVFDTQLEAAEFLFAETRTDFPDFAFN